MKQIKQLKNTAFFLFFLIISLLFSLNALALQTRLNITLSEVVYQNTSFAKYFELNETQDYCRIEGTLNITNPSNDTVFDIYLGFSNTEKLTSDLIWQSGRNGTQYRGGAGIEREYGEVGNTTNNLTIQDLDDDNNNDYMWVNSTHIIFNISSESGIIAIRLHNSTDNVSIANAGTTPVPIELIENITGSAVYGNITINGTANQDNKLNALMTVNIKEKPSSLIVLHVPELRPGNRTTFIYNISCQLANSEPPIDIETSYTNNDHPYNKKVLAGYNWSITQTLTNRNYLHSQITNINISIYAQNVTWNSTAFNFSLEYLNATGDYAHVTGNGTSNYHWYWLPNGGTLNWNQSENITYIVRAPYSVPFTATYKAIVENLEYQGTYLMSNLSLEWINASADINQTMQKRIYQPADNENNHNVTWEIRPKIKTLINISYDIRKITLWVTQNYNPNNDTSSTSWGLLERNFTGNPLERINISHELTSSSYLWYFNYTDGSNSSYPPPIVWMKPYWIITNAYNQILNYTQTRNGNDLYIKYIYVINGYWLEIKKNVTNIGRNSYQINISVENIGNGWTPRYEYVTVYDFVPNEFTVYNMSYAGPVSNQTVGAPGSEYYGTAFQWQIPWKGTMNSSLGPKYGPDAVSAENYSWHVDYKVNGTGVYKVTDLYIVGLDPLKVDGASASPLISVISSFQSFSKEIIYISIIIFLIIINLANLLLNHKINKRIEDYNNYIARSKSKQKGNN